jgi:hypothetical protein
VPGTNLTLVVNQDFKYMFHYQISAHGRPVSDWRAFGSPCAKGVSTADIIQQPGIVRISWKDKCQNSLFVEFDIQRGQIVRDSNLADSPPAIRPHG